MEKLLELYSKLQAEKQSLQLTLEHDKTSDWFLQIDHKDSNTVIFSGEHNDFNFLGSQAYIALYSWFIDEFEYIP